MARYIVAQVSFTGTLWSDGELSVTEMGHKRDGYLRKPERYNRHFNVPGDWDVEQLAYAVWAGLEEHV